MKIFTFARLIALLLLGSIVLGQGATLALADNPGPNPATSVLVDTLSTERCVSQTLAPGEQVWFKVAYHAHTDLALAIKAINNLTASIYTPAQIAQWPALNQPTGRLTPNVDMPGYMESWLGHLNSGNESGFFYVLVTNSTPFPSAFSFCTQEKSQFVASQAVSAPVLEAPVCAGILDPDYGCLPPLPPKWTCPLIDTYWDSEAAEWACDG